MRSAGRSAGLLARSHVSIRTLIDDASVLWQADLKIGAFVLVLVTAAGISRKRYPSGMLERTVDPIDENHRTRDASQHRPRQGRIEPYRVFRRPFWLSHAANAVCSK